MRPVRREYGIEFKAAVLMQTRQPGASVSSVALKHGLNANMVQRWRREEHQRQTPLSQHSSSQEFVPLRLASASAPRPGAEPAKAAVLDMIRLERSRPDGMLTVHLPVSAASQCAQMLSELLR